MGSDRWPSIQLCYECFKKVSHFFAARMPELLDGNPLAVELLGIEQCDDRYRLWLVDESFVCREFYFSDSQKDS